MQCWAVLVRVTLGRVRPEIEACVDVHHGSLAPLIRVVTHESAGLDGTARRWGSHEQGTGPSSDHILPRTPKVLARRQSFLGRPDRLPDPCDSVLPLPTSESERRTEPVTAELTLQQVAKYNKNRTAADHELIYKMATVLGTTRFVEQTGSSFMKGVACMDIDGVQRMFVAAGRAYVHQHPENESLLATAGIRVVQGVTEDQRIVLFSNAGGVAEGIRRREDEAPRASCPTCWVELPVTGVCDNC